MFSDFVEDFARAWETYGIDYTFNFMIHMQYTVLRLRGGSAILGLSRNREFFKISFNPMKCYGFGDVLRGRASTVHVLTLSLASSVQKDREVQHVSRMQAVVHLQKDVVCSTPPSWPTIHISPHPKQ